MSVRGSSGLRSRNFSNLTGQFFFTLEFTWVVGDRLIQHDLHLLYHARLTFSTEQVLDLQAWAVKHLSSSMLHEVYYILSMTPGFDVLSHSWFSFLNASNSSELHSLLHSCELFASLFEHPSFDDVTGLYSDFQSDIDCDYLISYFVIY